jgi:glyoxylase-like metal-dependent hydrolase (beta-lactamase superfamily II)
MKRVVKWMVPIFLIIGAAYYWLLIDNRPGVATATIDITALRSAANSIAGDKPDAITVETVSRRQLPATLMVAGGGLGRHEIAMHSFRVGAGDRSVIIDTGFSRASAEAMGVDSYDDAAQMRVNNAMRQAAAIVVTHEHLDHIGGVLEAPDWRALLPKALITGEQFDHPEITKPINWPSGSRAAFKPLRYDGVRAIAPGVALVKAPSHTPGSQLVFVQLANGREYLFMGDISSMDRNWRETRARSRLIGDVLVDEDRGAVFGWLTAFKALATANPELILVPSHDGPAIARLIASGAISRGM